jgi:hypothetical protein
MIGLASLMLAAGLGMQATSGVVTRTAPDSALQVSPNNGIALGRKAFFDFRRMVDEGRDVTEAAKAVAPMALEAHAKEPLNPPAHAILALAEDDADKRAALLGLALKLNRRSLPLQGASMQDRLARDDQEAVIETLDQILRVHPDRSDQFFEALAQALENDQALPTFQRILAVAPPWKDKFLRFAAARKASSANAARVRQTVEIEDKVIDRLLISRLAQQGNYPAAAQHYAFLINKDGAPEQTDWPSRYPPLDWKFADERELRAQASRDGKRVEIYVRSGSGGVLMERLFPASGRAIRIKIAHDLRPAGQEENFRLQIRCGTNRNPVFEQPFSQQEEAFEVPNLPASCTFARIGIYARSVTGLPALRGDIMSIDIES